VHKEHGRAVLHRGPVLEDTRLDRTPGEAFDTVRARQVHNDLVTRTLEHGHVDCEVEMRVVGERQRVEHGTGVACTRAEERTRLVVAVRERVFDVVVHGLGREEHVVGLEVILHVPKHERGDGDKRDGQVVEDAEQLPHGGQSTRRLLQDLESEECRRGRRREERAEVGSGMHDSPPNFPR
jgi:hypothetical protein